MPIPTQTQEMLLPPQNRIAPEKRDAFIAVYNARLTKLIFFLSVLWVFASAAVTTGFGQTLPAEARGIVLYQDLQTRYVEAFGYLACAPVNAYITGYTLPGGINRQAHNTGILKVVEFPMPGSTTVPMAAPAKMPRRRKGLSMNWTLWPGSIPSTRRSWVMPPRGCELPWSPRSQPANHPSHRPGRQPRPRQPSGFRPRPNRRQRPRPP